MLIRLTKLYKFNVHSYTFTSRRLKSILSASEIRQEFFDYFINEKQHSYWHSSNVVPGEDSLLSFVNAGMYQV